MAASSAGTAGATAHRSVDDVLDPGLATGPLAAALRPARTGWDDLEPGEEVVCPPAVRPYALSLLAERAAPLLVLTARTSEADGSVKSVGWTAVSYSSP